MGVVVMSTTSAFEIPVYSRLPLEIRSGEGATLYDADGNGYVDFYAGHATAQLGYAHPHLVGALERQATELFFQSNLVELDVRRRACERLAGFAPADLDHVFFVNSGAEANENALRIAFRHTRRRQVVALRGAFHGRTAAAGACSDGAERWYGFPERPFRVTFVEPEDGDALAAAVTNGTAAIILEPVQGMAGARVLSTGFLERAREVADARGALIIADEVQSGMGRCGTPFAIDASRVPVDILTTAKGLAGGFPCGAVITGPAIAGSLEPGDLGSTFGGGPMACAMVEAVIDVLEEPGFLEQVSRLEGLIRQVCQVGPVQSIHGRGLLLGLRTSRPAREVLVELFHRRILAGGAHDPHVVRLLPPLIITEEHVEALRDVLLCVAP